MNWLAEHWSLVTALVVAGLSLLWMLPSDHPRPRLVGVVGFLVALGLIGYDFLRPEGDALRDGLFYLFAATAVGGGLLMVTDRNPVYAALWFAIVTLGVCGLFLLNSAPFLAATTIIVYAGAVVVTFVFVIMLAQQEGGGAVYDRRSQNALLGTVLGLLFLGSVLYGVDRWRTPTVAEGQATAGPRFLAQPNQTTPNLLSVSREDNLGSLRGLGRTLFTDYLYAVELAGTILLVATIGAVAISPRRSQGTL